VRRSPVAPRRQARVSTETRNRSPHARQAATRRPASSASGGRSGAASSPTPSPAAATAAARQGRLRVQAAHLTVRRRRYWASAEAPGWPTLARKAAR
jgi:hypothetical protein